jgi:ABC-type branched-subunit amino acid transport system ATPase component/branched-subunit amino acid ABC-type transport system permease component
MTEILRFALVGFGIGAIYGLLGQGLLAVYRSAGVLNLAQGAFAMTGAYVFLEFRGTGTVDGVRALLIAIGITSALGVLSHIVIFKHLQQRSELTRLIAALGLLLILESAFALHYGSIGDAVAPLLPIKSWEVLPNIEIGQDRVIIFLIGVAVTAAIWVAYRYTAFGRVTIAVAENRRSAAALGYSVQNVSAANWAVSGALAGLAGALLAPISGIQVSSLSLLVVPALAAVLAGGFRSFPITFIAGVAIAVAQSLVSAYVTTPGWSQAVPFLLIAIVLTLRGKSYPGRGEILQALPRVAAASGTSRIRTLAFGAILIVLFLTLGAEWNLALLASATFAVIGLSVYAVTGLAGQPSLATFALAGIGSLTAARVEHATSVGLIPAVLIGGASAGIVGVIVGIPALRTRGPNLAIITLGLGVVIDAVIFSNLQYGGGVDGISVGVPSLFGSSLTSASHYGVVVAVILVLLVIGMQNLRRGGTGRMMLAVRANERAAATLGIDIGRVKLYAFAISAVIAGFGGVLLSFRSGTVVVVNQYGPFLSLTVVGLVVMGSVGYPSGALIGACLAGAGVASYLFESHFSISKYVPLIGGIGVVLTVLMNPDGIAAATSDTVASLRRRRGRKPQIAEFAETCDEPTQDRKRDVAGLVAHRIGVKFGATTILHDVSLSIPPGKVVGLIGPNGAGKTTFIDAMSGLIRSSGSITLDDVPIDRLSASRRSRAGLGRSFQSLELFEDLTVLENVTAGTGRRRAGGLRDFFLPRPPLLTKHARIAIDEFELREHLNDRPGELGFGRRRMVGIARALSTSPSVILLDEPGAGLDARQIMELGHLIRRIAKEWGLGVLLVEHDIDMVLAVCDQIVVLESGRVLASGKPAEIAANEAVIEAYIGGGADEHDVDRVVGANLQAVRRDAQ